MPKKLPVINPAMKRSLRNLKKELFKGLLKVLKILLLIVKVSYRWWKKASPRARLALSVGLGLLVLWSSFSILPKHARKPQFRRSLLGSSYQAQIPGIMETTFAATKNGAEIELSRAKSTLSMNIPLDRAELKKEKDELVYSVPEKVVEARYQLLDNGLKEEIVLLKKPGNNQFPTELKTKNLTFKLTPDGIPVFFDAKTGEYQFHLLKPFAKDAKGALTYGVQYTLSKKSLPKGQQIISPLTEKELLNPKDKRRVEKGRVSVQKTLLGELTTLPQENAIYVLTTTVDEAWLNDPQRAFPITIDPTVVHDTGTEFSAGSLNRVQNVGVAETNPSLVSYYHELPTDINTVGLWHFNETANDTCSGGQDACDSSGNGFHGTGTGTAIDTTGQVLGAAARTFDGTDDIITVSEDNKLDPAAITIEAWIKPNVIQTGNFVNKGNNSGYRVRMNVTTGTVTFFDRGGTNSLTSNRALDSGKWYHVAVTGDSSGLKIYINGVLDTANTTAYGSPNTADDLIMGKYVTSNNEYFSGDLDEVRISNVARTPEEIKANAQRGPYAVFTSDAIDLFRVRSWNSLSWTELGIATGDGETLGTGSTGNLVAQWNFNSLSGGTAVNNAGSCGTTCNGTLTNFADTTGQDIGGTAASISGWTANNKRWGAGALMLDGTDDYVNVGDINDFRLTGAMTLESWVWVDSGSGTGTIMSKMGDNGWRGYQLYLLQAPSSINFNIASNSTTLYTTSTSISWQTGWLHIVAVYNPSTETAIYVNGVKVASRTDSVPASQYSDNSQPFRLGARAGGTLAYLKGMLDSARIYSRTLSASEILSNYNAGNIEFQTRVGSSANPDDGTWEAWRPITGESAIASVDNDASNWKLKANATSVIPLSTQDVGSTAPAGPTGCASNKPVLINNLRNSNALTDYQIKLTVPYLTGMNAAFTDLRFTNSSGTNLDYWLETYTASTIATAWVEVDSIPANASAYIYMWYNSCSGGNASSGANTFLFFDNFDNLDNWSNFQTSNQVGVTGLLYATGNEMRHVQGTNWFGSSAWTNSNFSKSTSVSLDYDFKIPQFSTTAGCSGVTCDTPFSVLLRDSAVTTRDTTYYGTYGGGYVMFEVIPQDSPDTWSAGGATYTGDDVATGTWYSINFQVLSDGTVRVNKDGVNILNGSDTLSDITSYKIEFHNGNYQTTDNFTIRKVRLRQTTTIEPVANIIDNPTRPYIEGVGSLKTSLGALLADQFTVGLWHFDETGVGTGSTAYDSSGNKNHGTATGTSLVDGFAEKARSFDGSSNITVLDSSSLNPSVITVEAWVKTADAGNSRTIVSKTTGCATAGYLMWLNENGTPGAGKPGFWIGTGAWLDATTAINDNKWHHVAGTYDGTTSRIYIDGVLNVSAARSGTTSSATNLQIGGSTNCGQNLTGQIDGVRISAKARTAEEIMESYRAGREYRLSKTISSTDLSAKGKLPFYIASDRPGAFMEATIGESAYANYEPDANTMGLWHLEEAADIGGTGPTTSGWFKDSSDNANNGSAAGTTLVSGKMGKARYFDGVNDYINLGDSASLEISPNLTVEGWFYPTSFNNNWAVAKWVSSTPAASSYLLIPNYSTNSRPNFFISNGTTTDFLTGPYQLQANQWYHLAATFAAGEMKMYINGMLSASKTSGTVTSINVGSTSPVVLGQDSKRDNTGPYAGYMDEVRISNVARTADEIRQSFEISKRTHPITVDFKAALDSGNLIADSDDTGFTIDATDYGAASMGSNLFKGDKIIVKEKVNDTEYLAQGTVTAVTASSGAVTVASWDSGSTFPTGGFTTGATVFKWQREYFDLGGSLSTQRDGITTVTLRFYDGSQGANVWLDDIRSVDNYLTTAANSTITSSTNYRYFQYRTILSSNDAGASPSLSSVTVDYEQNTAPSAPTTPWCEGATNPTSVTDTTPEFSAVHSDAESDAADQYEIEVNTASDFNGTVMWDSGQVAIGSTVPSSRRSGDFTYAGTALTLNGTTYHWRIRFWDTLGDVGSWSATQQFTMNAPPTAPSTPWCEEATNPTGVSDASPEFSAIHSDPDSDAANAYEIEVGTDSDWTTAEMWDTGKVNLGSNLASGSRSTDVSYGGSTLSFTGVTYYWRIRFWDVNDLAGAWSTTQEFTTALLSDPDNCSLEKNALNTQITVKWTDTNTTETGYEIQRKTDGAAYAGLYTTAADAVSYADGTVSTIHTYQYRIRARKTDAYSNWCETVTLSLGLGNFKMEGIKLDGLKIQ